MTLSSPDILATLWRCGFSHLTVSNELKHLGVGEGRTTGLGDEFKWLLDSEQVRFFLRHDFPIRRMRRLDN